MIEYLIIAIVVLWSAVIVFKNVMPKTYYQALTSTAEFALKRGWDGVAKWLMPKQKAQSCGGGCGCDTDSIDKQQIDKINTVKWK